MPTAKINKAMIASECRFMHDLRNRNEKIGLAGGEAQLIKKERELKKKLAKTQGNLKTPNLQHFKSPLDCDLCTNPQVELPISRKKYIAVYRFILRVGRKWRPRLELWNKAQCERNHK
uniref:Uncharacterized protein n=1 Tax=Schistocephalus solidus TaxID=70667 RepID=A0A0X3NLW2_SCHSO